MAALALALGVVALALALALGVVALALIFQSHVKNWRHFIND